MMRSYAGMVENTLTTAESRAKQIGSALARDTAGQAQQALSQIERLREEAQAHTARAVGDLKSSFETVITQIGRQLEQTRGQFDSASRGMRDAAQKTATDLDFYAAGDAAPHGRPAAADGASHGRHPQGARRSAEGDRGDHPGADAAADPEPGAGALPRAAIAAAAGAAARIGDEVPASEFDAPAPQYDPRGRPVGGDADLSALAQRVSGASRGPAGGEPQRGYQQGPAEYRQPERRGAGWSVGDLLTNADAPGYPPQRPDPYAPRAPQAQQGGNQGLRLDEIARAIDHRTAAEVWQRFRAGERGVLGRHLYSLDGQATFDEISRRYDRDGDFRATVDRYIGDFERLLREAEQNDPEGRVMQNYMTSETGRVYLLLAHASGRLR